MIYTGRSGLLKNDFIGLVFSGKVPQVNIWFKNGKNAPVTEEQLQYQLT